MSQVRLRLARFGVANRPYFHLVAIPAQKSRNGLPLEKLGEYDPTPRIRVTGSPARKLVEWNVHRIHHWLNNGAMPTKCVTKLLMRGGVLPQQNKYFKSSFPSVSNSQQDQQH